MRIKQIRSDALKGTPNRKAKEHAIIKSARRQVLSYLKKNNIKHGFKQIEYIHAFCAANKLQKPQRKEGLKWLVEIYLDKNFDLIKSASVSVRNYTQSEWLKIRKDLFFKYGKVCMRCNNKDKTMHVDHIKPYSLYPELSTDLDNLQILCASCNIRKSNKNEIDYRPKI